MRSFGLQSSSLLLNDEDVVLETDNNTNIFEDISVSDQSKKQKEASKIKKSMLQK
jgi:hypothetical protein